MSKHEMWPFIKIKRDSLEFHYFTPNSSDGMGERQRGREKMQRALKRLAGCSKDALWERLWVFFSGKEKKENFEDCLSEEREGETWLMADD